MGSAFDWSPGGCCCTAASFFDLFSYGGPVDGWPEKGNQAKYIRACSMYPVNSDSSDLRRTSFPNWIIEPSVSLRSWVGYTSDGRTVWAGVIPTSGAGRFAAYDVAGQTELFSNVDVFRPPLYFTPGGFATIVTGSAAINATQYAAFNQSGSQSGMLSITDRAGTKTTSGPYGIGATFPYPGDGPDRTTTENIDRLAVLDWPHASVLKIVTVGGTPVVPAVSKSVDFEQVELGTSGTGHLALGNKQTIRHVDYDQVGHYVFISQQVVTEYAVSTPQWIGYDHFNSHHASSIWYDTTPNASPTTAFPHSRHNKLELIIDGIVAFSQTDIRRTTTTGSQNVPTLTPHICFPHESLGDGYVAVLHSVSPAATGAGTEMRVYKDGALLWTTNASGGVAQIMGSTDRWIYFRTAGPCTIPQVTNSEFGSSTGSENTSSGFWIAKHDGSQIIPLGILSDTFEKIQILFTGTNANIAMNGNIANSMARDSTVITRAMPATYQEMYDIRSGM